MIELFLNEAERVRERDLHGQDLEETEAIPQLSWALEALEQAGLQVTPPKVELVLDPDRANVGWEDAFALAELLPWLLAYRDPVRQRVQARERERSL